MPAWATFKFRTAYADTCHLGRDEKAAAKLVAEHDLHNRYGAVNSELITLDSANQS